MNNVILVGTIVMVVTTLSLSFDSDYPEQFVTPDGNITIGTEARNRYSSLCMVSLSVSRLSDIVVLQARLWLLVLAFTLSFGSLFSKMWQIYRLYTNPKLKNQVPVSRIVKIVLY